MGKLSINKKQDLEEKLVTIPHESYITPSSQKILEVAREQEIKGKFGANLTKDMSNMFSHYDASNSRYGIYGGYRHEKFDPSKALVPFDKLKGSSEQKSQQQKTQDFLKKLPYSKYEGVSPAHKAMRCLSHISSMLGAPPPKDSGGSEESNDDWLSELISNIENPQEAIDDLERNKEMIDNMSDFQKECLSTEDLENFSFSKELFMQLDILSRLKDMSAIKTKGSVIKHRDNKGKHRVNMRMQEISDVSRVKKVNMLLPSFAIKLANKEFFISEKIRREDKKQILFYLEDDSGSMSTNQKIAFCNAVLLNRCEAVAKGEAELVFYSYEKELYNRQHITTKEEALTFYNHHKKRDRRRGNTDIGGCVLKAIEEIKSMDGVYPEIMIVCDGQDLVVKTNTKGVKVHAFIIGQENKGLKDLCVGSGGIYKYEQEEE